MIWPVDSAGAVVSAGAASCVAVSGREQPKASKTRARNAGRVMRRMLFQDRCDAHTAGSVPLQPDGPVRQHLRLSGVSGEPASATAG